MIRQQSSKYRLFLMELIIVIFFFIIASAVCVQLYAEAHRLSMATRDLNNAIIKIDGAAELIRSSPMHPERALVLAFNQSVISDKEMQVGYDQEWQPSSLDEADYIMAIDWQANDQMLTATIEMRQRASSIEDTIYHLDVIKHLPITLN